MRWNRSRWVPRAWATAALIGSACDTHTIVPPGWAARSRSSVDDDAVLHLREALAAGEAERRRRPLHGAPTPAASSAASARRRSSRRSRTRAGRGRRRGLQAARPWRSAPPSPGPARAATCRRRRPASARRCAPPPARPARGRRRRGAGPGARPGRTLPVVGVWPWRTRRTVVTVGAAFRGRRAGGRGASRHCRRPQPNVGRHGSSGRRVPAGFFERSDERARRDVLRAAAPGHPHRRRRHRRRSAGSTTELGLTGDVLDLMSSWVSHFRTPPAQLTVLGMNAAELARNPMATAERSSTTSTPTRTCRSTTPTFDAVTCCVSVDYLVRPVEVFADVGPGAAAGRAASSCTFSNRCFPTKAIRGWLANDDRGRLAIVDAYFEAVGGVRASRRSPTATRARRGDPLYAAWATPRLTADAGRRDVVELPGLPAPRGVAGAGRRRAGGRRSVTRRTGVARCPASAIRRPGSSCSAWRRPPTAPTAPAGCSPATAAATSCSRSMHRAGLANQPTLDPRRRRAGAATGRGSRRP